jgi:putative addiction module component (TIGR02574 family)
VGSGEQHARTASEALAAFLVSSYLVWYHNDRICIGAKTMAVSLKALGIDRLSVRERLELIEQIWDSLPEQITPEEVPPWHLEELARRRAQAEARPRVGKP